MPPLRGLRSKPSSSIGHLSGKFAFIPEFPPDFPHSLNRSKHFLWSPGEEARYIL